MEYKIISTGSKGNAVVVDGRILIDCGVPFRRLESVYRDLDAVLLTHIHSDHFQPKTLARLAAERPSLRFFACRHRVLLRQSLRNQTQCAKLLLAYLVQRWQQGVLRHRHGQP